MATGRKITEFTEVTSLADQDVLLVVDSSDTTSSTSGTTKKVSFSNVKTGVTSGLNTTNWDTAYGWGNHASANYIGDGDFTSSGLMKRGSSAGSYSIVADNSANWDTAYGWGDHSTEGYLTSLGDAAGVTSTKIAQWDAAYGWGNHGSAGYLTSVAMTNISDVDLSIAPSDGQVLKWEASSSSWKPANDLTGGSNASLSSFSVATATAGTASLSYSNTTGVFTYTPPTFASVASNGAGVTDGNLTTQRITVGGLDSTQNIKLNSGKYIYNGLDPAALGSTMGSIDISALGYATRGLFRGASSTSAIVFEGYYKPTGETVAKLDMKGDLYLYTTGGDLKFSATTATGVDVIGDTKSKGFKLTENNTTISGTAGTAGEVRQIGGAPFYYDGTTWREFYLIDGSIVTVQPDTDWGNVIIRSTFDTNTTDVKYNVTPDEIYGSSTTSTAISVVTAPRKVGVGAVRINGGAQSGSRLQYEMTSDYDFTGAWTMEAWVFLDSASWSTTAQSIFSSSGANGEFALLVSRETSTSSNAEFSWYNTQNSSHNGQYGSTIDTITSSDIVDAWCHVALVRSDADAKIRLYLNGTLTGSAITDNDIVNPDFFNLGGMYSQISYSYNFDGYLDDVRISKSTRYTSSFTAPTTQLPVTGSTTQIIPQPSTIQGEIDLGSSPAWKGTSGVTVSQQSSGVYRLTFTTSYSDAKDYYVITQGMEQTYAITAVVTRATTHVDIEVRRDSNNDLVDTGDLAVQIVNHR